MNKDILSNVGKGWHSLLSCLLARVKSGQESYIKLRNENKWASIGPAYTLEFKQIKEKFGGLRIYFYMEEVEIPPEFDKNWYKDFLLKEETQLFGYVHALESVSYTICEKCGCPGHRRNLSWIQTLCDSCYNAKIENL